MEASETKGGKSKTIYIYIYIYIYSSEVCENEKYFYHFSSETTELRRTYRRIIQIFDKDSFT